MQIIVNGSLSETEVQALVSQELDKINPELQRIEILELTEVSPTEVDVQVILGGFIKRVRRITGYLSNIDNFNPAKKAECRDRKIHEGGVGFGKTD